MEDLLQVVEEMIGIIGATTTEMEGREEISFMLYRNLLLLETISFPELSKSFKMNWVSLGKHYPPLSAREFEL